MPKPDDRKNEAKTAGEVMRGVWEMLVTFFRKLPAKRMIFVLLFLLFYRFPEASRFTFRYTGQFRCEIPLISVLPFRFQKTKPPLYGAVLKREVINGTRTHDPQGHNLVL